ncbi:MAG: hypothetical protein ACPL1A_09850 [Candidatus Kapaibacteriota bacterium]
MRSRITILLVLILISNLKSQNLGIQLLVGNDFYKINSLEKGFNLLDLTKANIKREQFKNPFSGELNIVYKNINWGVMLSVDAAYTNYNVIYSRNYPQLNDPFYIKTSQYKIDFARGNISVNYLRNLLLSNNLKLFYGGGPGFSITAPIVSDKFIINTLTNKISELDFSKDIKLKYSLSAVLQSGIVYELFDPVGIILSVKYFITSKGEYEEPYSFASIHAGITIW